MNEMAKTMVEILREKGETIYSFSRLMSLRHCMKEFKFTYIDKIRGGDNIWSRLGSALHDCLEKIYNGELDEKDFIQAYFKEYSKIEKEGYKFPSDLIHHNTTKAVNHFIDNFKKEDYKCECERHFVTNIKGIWLQGFIDLIIFRDDGTIDIVDYKVSSKFSKKDLIDKGKQLTLYAYAMERQGFKVNKCYFHMLKYVNLTWKIGRKKAPLTERKDIWNDSNRTRVEKAAIDSGRTAEEGFDTWLQLSEHNTLDIPDWLKEYVDIDYGMLEWEYNEEHLNELFEFVEESVDILKNEKDYNPVKIDSKTQFYCTNLCGHRSRCEAYKNYVDSLPVSFSSDGDTRVAGVNIDELF